MKPEARAFLILMAAIALIVTALMLSGAKIDRLRDDIDSLQTQVRQMQEERMDAEQLRAELEDVKAVQGYIVWEQDWRNKKERLP